MKHYKQVVDGLPYKVVGEANKFVLKEMCCDCRLVHLTVVEVKGPTQLICRSWRDKRATANARRKRK